MHMFISLFEMPIFFFSTHLTLTHSSKVNPAPLPLWLCFPQWLLQWLNSSHSFLSCIPLCLQLILCHSLGSPGSKSWEGVKSTKVFWKWLLVKEKKRKVDWADPTHTWQSLPALPGGLEQRFLIWVKLRSHHLVQSLTKSHLEQKLCSIAEMASKDSNS